MCFTTDRFPTFTMVGGGNKINGACGADMQTLSFSTFLLSVQLLSTVCFCGQMLNAGQRSSSLDHVESIILSKERVDVNYFANLCLLLPVSIVLGTTRKLQFILSERTMNVCINFHGNPSNRPMILPSVQQCC